MTAVRMVYLDCDIEECDSSTSDETFDTVAVARDFARQAGWVYRGGKDLCPWCRTRIGPYHHGDEHIRPGP